jgi:hypothetical protein
MKLEIVSDGQNDTLMLRLRSGFRLTSTNHPALIWDGARPRICPSRHWLMPAQIFVYTDERLGQPVISHGLPLTKIHAHLIGVDPDFRVDVSERLLDVIGASLSKIC